MPYILGGGWGWEGGIDLGSLENTTFESNKKKPAFDQILTFFISVSNDTFVGICSKDLSQLKVGNNRLYFSLKHSCRQQRPFDIEYQY